VEVDVSAVGIDDVEDNDDVLVTGVSVGVVSGSIMLLGVIISAVVIAPFAGVITS